MPADSPAPVIVDARGLMPPEPLNLTLEALDTLPPDGEVILLLYREPWVPLNWKCVSAWRLVLKIGFMVIVPAARWQHLRQSARGFLHGLQSRTNQPPAR